MRNLTSPWSPQVSGTNGLWDSAPSLITLLTNTTLQHSTPSSEELYITQPDTHRCTGTEVDRWYSERESNPHGHKVHKILSLACLPIPPPERFLTSTFSYRKNKQNKQYKQYWCHNFLIFCCQDRIRTCIWICMGFTPQHHSLEIRLPVPPPDYKKDPELSLH